MLTLDKKEISLIIPTYNSEDYILKTISVAQKFLRHYDYEIIVVDDGSSDSTVQQLNRLEDSRLNIIVLSHTGVSHARNVGIKKAVGDYLMFCDADDSLMGTLPYKEYSADIISFSQNCKKSRMMTTNSDKLSLIESLFGFNQSTPNFPAFYGGSVSKLFKRELLLENRVLFDENLANSEDVLFNMQAILLARKIMVEHRGIYCYQGRLGSVTHQFDPKLLLNHIKFIQKVKELSTSINNSSELISRIESLYLYQLVFRYFLFEGSKERSNHYQKWVKSLKCSKWNPKLNRQIERITILLTNYFGINSAVYFAKLYNFVKHILRPEITVNQIL